MSIRPHGLTERQYQFCQLYTIKYKLKNRLSAYAEAYDYDLADKNQYNICQVEAWRNLRKTKIIKMIQDIAKDNQEIFDKVGLTKEKVINIIAKKVEQGSEKSIQTYIQLTGIAAPEKRQIDSKSEIEIKSQEQDAIYKAIQNERKNIIEQTN